MVKARRRSEAIGRVRKPKWISDKENQRKWIYRFTEILKRDYANSDAVISATLNRERLPELCATRIRFYVDKSITRSLNVQTKARGVEYVKKLKLAIAGLHAASELSVDRGNQELALLLDNLADDFKRALGRRKRAFGTKRRGRDRDHSILYECRSFLGSELQLRITNRTLANLVNAGYEADGESSEEPITEEHIRKNLFNFKQKNPFWRNYIIPLLRQPVKKPETK